MWDGCEHFKPLISRDKEDEKTLAMASLFLSFFLISPSPLSPSDSRELVERDNKERIKIRTHRRGCSQLHGLMYASRKLLPPFSFFFFC